MRKQEAVGASPLKVKLHLVFALSFKGKPWMVESHSVTTEDFEKLASGAKALLFINFNEHY